MFFARIFIEIEELSPGKGARPDRQQALELLLHNRAHGRTFIGQDIVAAPVGIAIHEEGRLIDAIDDAVARDLVVASGNPRERIEEVGDMDDIADHRSRLDDAPAR